MSNQSPLIVETTSGPVQGFIDTFPLRDKSAAKDAENGIDGGKKAIWKWLVGFVPSSFSPLLSLMVFLRNFKGIPYARAGRWERPTAPEPWTEVFKAWEFR